MLSTIPETNIGPVHIGIIRRNEYKTTGRATRDTPKDKPYRQSRRQILLAELEVSSSKPSLMTITQPTEDQRSTIYMNTPEDWTIITLYLIRDAIITPRTNF